MNGLSVLARRGAAAAAFGACVLMLAPPPRAAAQTQKRPESKRIPKREPSPPMFTTPQAGEEPALQPRFLSPELLETPVDPETYVLGPGDLLAVMVMVGELRTEELPVLPEGMVLVPNVGGVQAAGRTLAEFRKALRSAMAKRYRDFELYCYLARARQFRVYVTGEVKEPGVVAARAYERVSDVVERAGGLTDRASKRGIELRDMQGSVQARVDLAAFSARGDLAANPLLSGGQVVWVPVRTRIVQVQGEVGAPGAYEVRPGESLADLLALAGGPTPHADLSQVSVETVDSTGTVLVHIWDLRRDSPAADGAVRVSVLSLTLGKNRVFATLPNGEERALLLSSGETLRDLVRRLPTLQADADLSQAELATTDADGKRVQVAVDLARVLSGAEDRPLKDGDVLSIPRVKNYVYVSGYVTEPGPYVYRADWTVNDYIGEAGGPTTGGSRDRVKILGPDGSRRSGNRETSLRRGDTIFVDKSFTGKASSFVGLFANLTALVISLVALNR